MAFVPREKVPGASAIGFVITDVNGLEIFRVGKYKGNGKTYNECESKLYVVHLLLFMTYIIRGILSLMLLLGHLVIVN